MSMYQELIIILLLISLNGLFAMSELAVVSARESRLRTKADRGSSGAKAALELTADPNKFLSTVQIGITFIGTLAGAYGGANLGDKLGERLAAIPLIAPYADTIGLVAVVMLITYLSLVIGELVPKRLALGRPERIAVLTARPLQQLAFVTTPLVKLLSISTETVLRLLRFKPSDPLPVTDEEITGLVDEGTKSGIFKPGEDELVRNVFRFADLPCRVAMTHRSEIEWIDKNSSPEQITQLVLNSPHSRFPVAEGDLDHAIGFVNVQDITRQLLSGEPIDLQAILHEHIPVYDGTPLLQVLEDFKERGIHLALIHDEHGSIDGMLTLNDLTDALVGDVPEAGIDEEPRIVRRDDGSWLLDGRIPADEAARLFKLTALPEGDFDTLAGMIITGLGHIPRIGDHYTWQGIRFDVVDMDGKRIDRVLASNAKDGEARPSG